MDRAGGPRPPGAGYSFAQRSQAGQTEAQKPDRASTIRHPTDRFAIGILHHEDRRRALDLLIVNLEVIHTRGRGGERVWTQDISGWARDVQHSTNPGDADDYSVVMPDVEGIRSRSQIDGAGKPEDHIVYRIA